MLIAPGTLAIDNNESTDSPFRAGKATGRRRKSIIDDIVSPFLETIPTAEMKLGEEIPYRTFAHSGACEIGSGARNIRYVMLNGCKYKRSTTKTMSMHGAPKLRLSMAGCICTSSSSWAIKWRSWMGDIDWPLGKSKSLIPEDVHMWFPE